MAEGQRRQRSASSSSDSDLETQLTGKASAMSVGTAARFVHAVYARADITAIREKFRCVGGAGCPMLTVVKACPEILRCQAAAAKAPKGKELPEAGQKKQEARIRLGRGAEGGLGLDQRFTLLRAKGALPAFAASPSRLPKGFEFRHVRFVDYAWH